MMEWNKIEKKWRARWGEQKSFEADPDGREKKFVTVAYPYPNSPQHIGHGRTYTLADVHARYYRMRGFNVLFPMAFHYTGTPILGMARRVEAEDPELLDVLRRIYGVADQDIRTFAEPVKIAEYFHKEIRAGMIEMGYSIDWRREFTTIDPVYQKFIEWQISSLREKGLIIQGSHPVGWCPKDANPVSQHDTLGDVEPDFTEYVLIKFRFGKYVIPTATLRPETLFGVTNLWVNPDVTYRKVLVDGDRWIVSAECAHKLGFLDKEVTDEGGISGHELAGQMASLPHGEGRIPILEAGFVEPHTGTGLVMSVPAHAPFDWQALEDLKKAGNELASGITPVSIIATPGYGDLSAREECERLGISGQEDSKLEEATTEVYGKEFYSGVLRENTGEFAGQKVAEAKDAVKEWLTEQGHSDVLLELTNAPVRCRCGAECVVKVLANQWFLNYGDLKWKEKATRCLENMSILPQEIRGEFGHVVGWLRERACARQRGLGTKLPWDAGWIVESLSDSVIYMAYYTLAKFVNAGELKAGGLSAEFFEHVFLGAGDAGAVSARTGVGAETLRRIRKEFSYFYPVDARHSGRDLVPNHLTFFVLNHVAIFPQELWPREIVVNGSILMDGKKMSKSLGNIIPLRQAIRDYGADPIRLAIVISAELLQDADFKLESVSGIGGRLEALYQECAGLKPAAAGSQAEDRWIKSMLQNRISDVTAAIEKMRLREALHSILFAFESDLQWYKRRAAAKKRTDTGGTLYEINSARIAMLSPFAPHIAEEIWEGFGHSEMLWKSGWPEASKSLIDHAAAQSEQLLMGVMDDIANIIKVTKISPKKITVYTAGDLKSRAYRAVLEKVVSGKTGMGAVMKDLVSNPGTAGIKKNPDFVQKAIKDVLSEPLWIRSAKLEAEIDEKKVLSGELGSLVRADLGAEVRVFSESDPDIYDPKGKARHARPFKPALLIE